MICSKVLFPELDYYSTFSLRCNQNLDLLFTESLQIALVQLDKFEKGLAQMKAEKFAKRDFWCYIFKKAPEINKRGFKLLSKSFGGTMSRLEEMSQDERAKLLEEYEEMARRDAAAHREEAVEEGIEKGLQTAARRMLDKKLSLSEISKWTGLTKEQIQKLKK